MPYLTKEQVKKIIQNAPAGTTPEGIIAGLRQKGHQLEGYDIGTKEQPAIESPKEKKTFVEKVGDFLGVGTLGKGLGLATFKYLTPEGRELKRKVSQGTASKEELMAYSDIFSKSPTVKQTIGSAIQTAATIGTAGIGTKLSVGAKSFRLTKALPTATKILPTMAKIGGAGAVAGFGAGLEEEKSVEDSLKQAFVSGLTSAATYGAIAGIGKLGKMALETLPSKIYNSVTKIESEASDVLMNEKQIGKLGQLKKISDNEVNKLNQEISKKITPESGSFNSKEFVNNIISKVKSEWQGYDKEQIFKSMKNSGIDPFLKNKSVNFKIADNVRKGIGETIGTVWQTDNPKFNSDVRMIIWKEIVNTIRPITNTTNEFSKLSAYTQSAIKLGKILERQKRFGVSLTDLITGIGVGGFGGIGGGIGAVAVKKTLESPLTKTGIAVGLNELNKLIPKLPFDKMGQISRVALINAIKELNR